MRTWFSSCWMRSCACRYSNSDRTWLACAARLRIGIVSCNPTPLSGALELTNWFSVPLYETVGKVEAADPQNAISKGFAGL